MCFYYIINLEIKNLYIGSRRPWDDHPSRTFYVLDKADTYQELRTRIKSRISDLDKEVKQDIKEGIVHRLMQKVEYAESVKWNNFIKKIPLKGKYNEDVYLKYLNKYVDVMLLLDTKITKEIASAAHISTGKEIPILYTSSISGHNFYIGPDSGDLQGVENIPKILNALGLDKESKKYILNVLKKYENKFANEVASSDAPLGDN